MVLLADGRPAIVKKTVQERCHSATNSPEWRRHKILLYLIPGSSVCPWFISSTLTPVNPLWISEYFFFRFFDNAFTEFFSLDNGERKPSYLNGFPPLEMSKINETKGITVRLKQRYLRSTLRPNHDRARSNRIFPNVNIGRRHYTSRGVIKNQMSWTSLLT